MSREDPQMKLRLPEEMHARLKAEAEANKRSMNAEIVARLETSFKERYLSSSDNNFDEFLSQPGITADDLVEQIKILNRNNSISIANLINAYHERIGLDVTTVKRKYGPGRDKDKPES